LSSVSRTITAATEPAVWLLDVDGVVNADRPGWAMAPYRRWVYADGEYRLRWAPKLLQRIRALVHASAVDLRWCTTWCPWAHVLEAAWGLPELPRALTAEQCDRSPGQVDTAKVAAARAVRAAGRRLIWTDDTAVPRVGPILRELTAGGQGLLIAPASRFGLLPEHMDQIEAFAAG
jgi:hypothetical protein